jgi:hypothetical protein
MKSAILSTALLLGAVLLTYFGVLGYVWERDTHYFSTVIAAFAVGAYVHGLWHPAHSAKYAEVAVALGLLGTVAGLSIGMAMVAQSGNALDAVAGAFSAYYATATGLVSAIALRVQGWLGGEE